MIVAENPLAASAGLAMLREGGSAIDAAIAAQMVLGLVEPQSSGIGGGAFILYWSAANHATESYDGRETAPAAARPDRFLDPQGTPLTFWQAVIGGRSVGVPGVLRALEMVHQRHGKLPWARLFQPAIDLAEHGFPISPRLHAELAMDKILPTQEPSRSYFYQADGTPKPVGTVLVNEKLAATLRTIAHGGADSFYQGPIAEEIVETVRNAANPGDLTAEDIRAYRARERPPVCGPYHADLVCGMGPPSSGGVTLLEILGMVEPLELARLEPESAASIHLYAEAAGLAYADRERYLADSDIVPVPVRGLLDGNYLRSRSQLIDPSRAKEPFLAGEPSLQAGWNAGIGQALELPSTSQISVVDDAGDALSMTTSIETMFGSHLMVDGFLLNNQLTDFSFLPERDGVPVANRVEPGKRPRSAMAPTLVFDRLGALLMVLGSPGGSPIINYVGKTIIGVLDWHLDIQAAIDLPNFGSRNGPVELEAGPTAEALRDPLTALGHQVTVGPFNSGLAAILVTPEGLTGGADPRREGVALGD